MTFPSSPFPRTEFDGRPCTTEPTAVGPTTTAKEYRQFKSIGLATCERCRSSACDLPYYRWEHERGHGANADRHVHSPPRDFPILRSSPLWQQTWLERYRRGREYWSADRRFQYAQDPDDGGWFPPVRCGEVIHVNGIARVENRRLYSTDNCSDCTAALQAVELMVYGAAWQMAGWQDDEHRCWFIDGECVCGNESWLSDSWCKHIDHWRYANHADSNGWARKFRTRPTQLPGVFA